MKRLMFLGISLVVLALALAGCAAYKCNYVTVDVPVPEGATSSTGQIGVSTTISPTNPVTVTPSLSAGDTALKTAGEVAKEVAPSSAAAHGIGTVVGETTKSE